jgi:hypothetical protein
LLGKPLLFRKSDPILSFYEILTAEGITFKNNHLTDPTRALR